MLTKASPKKSSLLAPSLPTGANFSTDQRSLKTVVVHVDCTSDTSTYLNGQLDSSHTLDRSVADDCIDSEVCLTRPTEPIPGFTLLEKLGEGGFAKVYLAEQNAIAGRQVVLKITEQKSQEADRLGRLHHPNVVPIYSVHQASKYWVICMPYLGRTTLADMIPSLGDRPPTATTCVAESSLHLPTFVVKSKRDVPTTLRPIVPPLTDIKRIFQVISDLASGLNHAHSQGILHLDMKPTNVLWADCGRPMLLDFNLSYDTTNPRRTKVGGTIPYMAPEQIAELISRESGKVDERTDLFGLGALAYELLTGEYAFPLHFKSRADLPKCLEDRRSRKVSVRAKNPRVSPAEDSIIAKLLAPNPDDRYQTALELITDIDRHLTNRLLTFTPNRSLRERLTKWRRRNIRSPIRLVTASIMGLGLGYGIVNYRNSTISHQTTAAAQARKIQNDLSSLRLDLTSPGESSARAQGRQGAKKHIEYFGVLHDSQWRQHEPFAALPASLKTEVAADLGELLLLLSHSYLQDGKQGTESERHEAAMEAMRLIQRAEDCFEGGTTPPLLHNLRCEISKTVNLPEINPPRDNYLNAVGLLSNGKYREAAPLFSRVISAEPGHAGSHFALAYCCQNLGQFPRALERYNIVHALLPVDARPVFNRGLVYGLQKKHNLAEAEFSLAIDLDSTHGESYWNRAIARFRQGKFREAEQDLSSALERNVSALQVFLLRARIRTELGNHRGAETDLHAATMYKPQSEADFLVRGVLQLPAKPDAALADFEAAASLASASLPALQNQAHVHSEFRHDLKRTLELLTRVVALHPDYAPARSGRAVMLARLGNDDEARQERETAQSLSEDSGSSDFLEMTDLYSAPWW